MKDQAIFEVLTQELKRQRENVELIASENYVSQEVMEVQRGIHLNDITVDANLLIVWRILHVTVLNNYLERSLLTFNHIRGRRRIWGLIVRFCNQGQKFLE